MTATGPAISISGLPKSHGNTQALDTFDLKVQSGEVRDGPCLCAHAKIACSMAAWSSAA